MSDSEYRSSREKQQQQQSHSYAAGERARRNSIIIDEAGDVYETGDDRKTIGLTSATFLILNRMIGTGIFATPSAIFALSGSTGLALFMWVAGTLIAAAG